MANKDNEVCSKCNQSDKVDYEDKVANKGLNIIRYLYCSRCKHGWCRTLS